MKKLIENLGWILAFLLLFPICARSQIAGVKTNALGWATLSPNVGLEVGFARHWSVDVDAAFNPFTFGEGRKTQFWGVQPELRYWPRYKFAGHFVGFHGHYAMYDWGLWKYRYKGNLKGFGFSYGYAWMFHKRWNLEGNIGLGYTRLDYDERYDRHDRNVCYGPDFKNYWGLSRIGISVTYFFK